VLIGGSWLTGTWWFRPGRRARRGWYRAGGRLVRCCGSLNQSSVSISSSGAPN